MTLRREGLAFGLAAAALWLGLGSYGLVEPSDARYAEIAREMWATGDYLFPRFLGILHFHKPPLIYWLASAGYAVFGANEWGARACQAVLGLALAWLVWRFARRHVAENAAPWAVALVATTPAVLGASHMLTTDLLLAAGQTLALTCWYDVWTGKGGAGARAAFYVGLGVAFLAKGPVGWLVPLLILGAFAYGARGRGQARVRWRPLWGVAIVAAVSLPWYLYAVWREPGLLSYFVGGQIASRLREGGMGHPHPWIYFFYVFPALGLPWLLLAPVGWRRLRGESSPAALFLLLWALVPPAFFTFPHSKLPLYVLLAYPAVAVLAAAALTAESAPWRSLGAAGAFFVLLGVALGVLGLGVVVPRGGDWGAVTAGDLARLCLPLAVAAVLAGAAALVLGRRGPGGARRGAALLAACLTAITAWAFSQGDLLPFRSARTVGLAAAAALRPGDVLAEYKDLSAGTAFYTGRMPLLVDIPREVQFESGSLEGRMESQEAFLKRWEGPGRVLAVARPKKAAELAHATELARGGGFVLVANR